MKEKAEGGKRKAEDGKITTGLRFIKGILSQDDKEKLITHAYKPFTLEIYPKQREDGSYYLEIVTESDGKIQTKYMGLGDTFKFTHHFDFQGEFDEPIFPMILEYKGVEYRLNNTKQGKLILTK